VLAWLFAYALVSEPPREPEEGDAPYVEILESRGAIDGPSEGGVALPTWERVRVELRVRNRLAVEVRDLEVEIALVLSSGTGEATAMPIPGWSIREVFQDSPVPPEETAYLKIARELPARRTSPRAEDIAYRARIKSYRLSPPDLDTAIRLLGSSHESDQMAGLKSYEVQPDMDRETVGVLGRSLAKALSDLPEDPAAPDALRMLFSVRAIGTLGDASQVKMLLELPASRDGRRFARAVTDLATRMVTASEAEEPRLRILPSWAKETGTIKIRAPDALEEAVRDAVLRMGDAAVPALLHEAHQGSVPGVRARAQRLLYALGRATVRSQLSLRDREARLSVIEVLGAIGSAESVSALTEILRGRDRELRDASMKAIGRIGPRAIEPLVSAMGTRNDDAILTVLKNLLPAARADLVRAAARYGVTPEKNETDVKLLERLRLRLFEEQHARLVQEIERALDLAREGSYTEAFQRLDAVFAQDPDFYMSFAKPIAEMYVARGRGLFQRGDFDAAISTLKIGQSIYKLPDAEKLLMSAELQLARGFLDLGDLEKAEDTLHEADPSLADKEMRTLEAKLLALRANQALANGDYGKARTLIDRAHALKLKGRELKDTSRRLMIAENLAIIIVLALLFPAFVLVVVLYVKRRRETARMRRLEKEIDRGGPAPVT
jgi:tetratricopeptide (TPR) repeat protein